MYLIIGYGNLLRSDDGLGQYLAEMLKDRWNVITSTQLTPELAEPISRVKRVVFIDAGVGHTPGKLTTETVRPLAARGAFTHNVTPASLLAAAGELYGAVPQVILISVIGASFDYGYGLSPQLSGRVPKIVKAVDEVITAFFSVQEGET
jgi:hydrogenase maturation protease